MFVAVVTFVWLYRSSGRVLVPIRRMLLDARGSEEPALVCGSRRSKIHRFRGGIELGTGHWILASAAMAAALGLAFFAGAERLDRIVGEARRDADRAADARGDAQSGGASIRLVEAQVRSRRSRAWGDDVLLTSTRPADGGPPVPQTLRLGLGRQGDGLAAEISEPSRAERLLQPGTTARLGLRIMSLAAHRNPGAVDHAHAEARRGIGARARLVDPDWVLRIETGSASWGARTFRIANASRIRFQERVRRRFGEVGASGALASALAFGDRRGLSDPLRDGLRRLGLSHLVAVSGLHVGWIAGLAGWGVLRLLALNSLGRAIRGGPFLWSMAVASVVAWLYGWFAGAPVSAQRAVLLFLILSAARVSLRSVSPARALSWAALVVLVTEPAALFDLGAQLSFAACASLILVGVWTGPGDGGRAGERFVEGLSQVEGRSSLSVLLAHVAVGTRVSLAVGLGTAPLIMGVGMPVSPWGPILNLVAIPWTGLVVLPASLAAGIGASVLPDWALYGLLLPGELTEGALVEIAAWLPDIRPWDGLSVGSTTFVSLVGLLALRMGGLGLALLAWVAVVLVGSPPAARGGDLAEIPRAIFFDVGQGDAALVQGESGAILIDTGGGGSARTAGLGLVRALRSIGVTRLDALVVTHGDFDHRGGATHVLDRLHVSEVWLPAGAEDDERLRGLVMRARSRGIRVRWLRAGAGDLGRGELGIDVLWPPERGIDPGSRNDGSLVMNVDLGATRILFAADVGSRVEGKLVASAAPLSADVLKVGHHGSRHGSTRGFLEAVDPSVAVISAPCDPARGLPSGAVLERLQRNGISLGWTGRDGAVSISMDVPGRLDLHRWASVRRCQGSRLAARVAASRGSGVKPWSSAPVEDDRGELRILD